MTNEELERAVEDVEALVLTYAGNTQYDAFRALFSERAELLAAVERMRGALEELIDHADQCMARLDYHDAGMLGDEPVKQARAALTTGEGK